MILYCLINIYQSMFADKLSLSDWIDEVKVYERQKRTKKPFGQLQPPLRITARDVKLNETKFNPVLCAFTDKSLQSSTLAKQKQKDSTLHNIYQRQRHRSHDMSSLISHSNNPAQQAQLPTTCRRSFKQQIQSTYDFISGLPLAKQLLQRKHLTKQKEARKRHLPSPIRDYDILDTSKPLPVLQDNACWLPHLHHANPQDMDEANQSIRQTNIKNRECQEGQMRRGQRHQLRYRVEDQHRRRGEYLQEIEQEKIRNRITNSRIPFRQALFFLSRSNQMQGIRSNGFK